MKATLSYVLFPVMLLFSCEKAQQNPQDGQELGVYYAFNTYIKIVDKDGTNLLDPKSHKRYTYDDIDVIEFKGKNPIPYYNPQSNYPKGYELVKWWEGENKDPSTVLDTGFDLSQGLTSVKHGKNGKIFSIIACRAARDRI